jgi:hypothetical protein
MKITLQHTKKTKNIFNEEIPANQFFTGQLGIENDELFLKIKKLDEHVIVSLDHLGNDWGGEVCSNTWTGNRVAVKNYQPLEIRIER